MHPLHVCTCVHRFPPTSFLYIASYQPTLSNMSSVDQEAWDEICVSPHQSQIDAGRREGRATGLLTSFNDGFVLGRQKALEFGTELGFILGCIRTVERNIQPCQDDDVERTERLQKRIDELRRAIDDFPSPDAIFANSLNNSNTDIDVNNDTERVHVSDGIDIIGSMQRIRAKFKVLTTILKIPHFSLMHVMADASLTESKEEPGNIEESDRRATSISNNATQEW